MRREYWTEKDSLLAGYPSVTAHGQLIREANRVVIIAGRHATEVRPTGTPGNMKLDSGDPIFPTRSISSLRRHKSILESCWDGPRPKM